MTRETDYPWQPLPNTIWTLVGNVGHGSLQEQRDTLNQLVLRYWPALCAHLVRCKHLQVAEAEDLLQDFLLKKVVERDIINGVAPGRGKFRSFLLRSLENFRISAFRHQTAAVRSPPGWVPIQEAMDEPDGDIGPSTAYDVAFAKQVLSDAIEGMRKKCGITGRADVWDVLQGRKLDPLFKGAAPVAYKALVARHRLKSPKAACNLMPTARRMLKDSLRMRVAEYEPNEAMIDEEIADLLRILSGGRRLQNRSIR